jgi:hypothetical protein
MRIQVVVCPGAQMGATFVRGQSGSPAPVATGCYDGAYDVQDSQIFGPDSINSDRFDIVARAHTPWREQRPERLRSGGCEKQPEVSSAGR